MFLHIDYKRMEINDKTKNPLHTTCFPKFILVPQTICYAYSHEHALYSYPLRLHAWGARGPGFNSRRPDWKPLAFPIQHSIMSVVTRIEDKLMTTDLLLSKQLEGFLLARKAEGYSPGALTQYEWGIERLLFVIGNKPINKITIDDLRSYLNWMQTSYINKSGEPYKLSPTSIFHAWKAIHAFYLWLHTEYGIERIDSKLQKPKFSYPEIIPFSEDEIRALLKATERTKIANTDRRHKFTMKRPTAKRDIAIIFLLLDTGIRVGELTRLTIADTDINIGELHVKSFSSGLKSRPRTIPIGVKTRKALWRYLSTRESHSDNLLFVSENGQPLTTSAVQQLLREIGGHAGIKKCHPHRFRHTFAIQYLRNGGDVFTLKRILGHSTLKMVERYLSLVNEDLKQAHEHASPVDRWKL